MLLVDLDAQSNTTKFFERYDEGKPYVGTLLRDKNCDVNGCVYSTDYDGIDILPANVKLIMIEKAVMMDTITPQQFRLKHHVDKIRHIYDYCIMDCSPSVNILNINGLAITDDVIVPLLVDDFSFTGLNYIRQTID